MRVTVFGGSAPKTGSPEYQQAYQLGQLLGKNGHTALTGGYIGTMEAVSRGCSEAGGHVIGVTCDEIEAWRSVSPNRWIMEEIRYPTNHQRLLSLIKECQAAIALPGGVGTLAEIAMMWNQLQTHAITPRPLVLVGDGWQKTFNAFFIEQEGYIPSVHRRYLSFADSIEAAYQRIIQS
jgi:uncharacterized protein (TIGR00730 family)